MGSSPAENSTRADAETSQDFRALLQHYHSFYEVWPYCVVIEEHHGNETTTRRIQAGFDVDIYGINSKDHLTMPGSEPDYEAGCAALQQVAEKVLRNTDDRCTVEVIRFPSTAIIDPRSRAVEGMVRIRIHHYRGLDQPFGPAEQRAMDALETELKALGLTRRH